MIEDFRKLFGSAEGVRIYRAPGRVNLIGEHTDYNLGFVCPVALQLATYIATAPSDDGQTAGIYSEERRQMREFDAAARGGLEPRGPLDGLSHRGGARAGGARDSPSRPPIC